MKFWITDCNAETRAVTFNEVVSAPTVAQARALALAMTDKLGYAGMRDFCVTLAPMEARDPCRILSHYGVMAQARARALAVAVAQRHFDAFTVCSPSPKEAWKDAYSMARRMERRLYV